jgi:DNA-binding MarR family transcriptional regulator
MNARNLHTAAKTKQHSSNAGELMESLDAALRRMWWLERVWLKQVLVEYDLDIPPYMVLMQLYKRDGVCPMGELAHALEQPNATTTGHVDRLEEKGLVKREFRTTSDRRQVRVHVTAQGKKLIARVQETRLKHLKNALVHLDAQDREHFVRLLQSYLEQLEPVK